MNFYFRIVWYPSSVSCSGQWNGSLYSTSAILHQFWGNQNNLNCWINTSVRLHLQQNSTMSSNSSQNLFNGIMLYITKVLECSWDELLTKVKEAEDFDNVIAAHQVFLNTVISRCLLDEQSRVGRYFISCDKFVILLKETLRYSEWLGKIYCIEAPNHTF